MDAECSTVSPVDSAPAQEPASRGYVLEGVVLEATAGRTAGPEEPFQRSGSVSVAAWFITQGKVEAVDVSGVNLVTVRHAVGHGQPDHAIVLLDEWAAPELLVALLNLIDGRLGKPPPVLSGVDAVYQVPIDYEPDIGRWSMSVAGRLRISLLADGMPATTQWTDQTAEVAVRFPEHDLVWDACRLNAHYGEFRFVG